MCLGLVHGVGPQSHTAYTAEAGEGVACTQLKCDNCPTVDYGGPDECEIWYMQLAAVTAYLTGTLSVLMLQL